MISLKYKKSRIALLTLSVLLTVAPQLLIAQSQTWEKIVAPGLTYRMEIDLGLPRVIHAFHYFPGSGKVFSKPALAGSQIFVPDDATKGREVLTKTIEANGALAGVNADFFPWSGDPIGMMIQSGELVSLPFLKRSAFLWGASYSTVGPIETTITFKAGDLLRTVDGLNEEAKDNAITLFTPIAAAARSTVEGNFALLSVTDKLTPNGTLKARVELITPDLKTAPVEQGKLILVGTGNQKLSIAGLPVGQEIEISTRSTGADFSKVVHAIGGGPRLIHGGKLGIDLVVEGMSESFSTTMHPRTAVGSTKEGDIWLVVIDGRQSMSRGASLDELAKVMMRLGCTEAINLDGGGSSTLALGTLVLNRPSDKGLERAICNSLLLFGDSPKPVEGETFVIKGVPNLEEGATATYSVVNSKGEKVPLNQVIWSAQGSAWIDQSGVLRTLTEGKAKISAWISGTVVSVEIEVGLAPPAGDPPPSQ
ncbi:MAG: phosphodiester glycosidase family protein [Fimbriimonadaceae bacterium]